jgi:hypothetical protein
VTPSSWILEVRARLQAPPPTALPTEGAAQAALVPLYVENGELWLLLAGATGDELVPASATLPTAPIETGADPWPAAERSASRLGVEPQSVLRLGLLDQLPSPLGDVVVPCVAAVPAPSADGAAAAPTSRLPLSAGRAPSLLEERRAVLRGLETWVTVAHFGPIKLAGVEVEILELLLERLFAADGG